MGEVIKAKAIHVPSIPRALKALAAMERELDEPRTYAEIQQIIAAAEAFKLLLRHVDEVKRQAEWVILVGNMHVGEEIQKVPKAKPGPKQLIAQAGKQLGRATLGIPGTPRARLLKLAKAGKLRLREIAIELWDAGKDATIRGVLEEEKGNEIKRKRADFEARRDRGARVKDLVAMAERGERFPVIYCDPPWEFKVYSGKGKKRSAERHYDTSSLDALKALPISPLAERDACLFMWAVWPELPGALDLIKTWDFEYKTAAFVWFKQVSDENEDLATGMGYWTRANSEVCLFATRGAPERYDKGVHQVICAPVMAHSVKPEETRVRIERLVIGPYLELFARRPAPGWTVWGNEIEDASPAEAAE